MTAAEQPAFEWVLEPGMRITVENGGQLYRLRVADIALAGPKEIRWQQGGKPPRLRSVTLVVETDG